MLHDGFRCVFLRGLGRESALFYALRAEIRGQRSEIKRV